MAKFSFVTPAMYQEFAEKNVYWLAPDDNSDFVERAGYRTVEQAVRELTLAGERLEDWRQAAYPAGTDVSQLDAFPVFGDQLAVLERFRALQKRREEHTAAYQDAIAREIGTKLREQEAAAAVAKASEPVRVVVVPA